VRLVVPAQVAQTDGQVEHRVDVVGAELEYALPRLDRGGGLASLVTERRQQPPPVEKSGMRPGELGDLEARGRTSPRARAGRACD
jgi:hypothetical protein